MKDSNKKCNGKRPHSFSGEGRAPRGLSKPPLSATASKASFDRFKLQHKKRRPKSP